MNKICFFCPGSVRHLESLGSLGVEGKFKAAGL